MPSKISSGKILRKTKIVCTIGPSTSSADAMKDLVKAGMDVARINFSHGTHKEHAYYIKTLRKVAKKLNSPLAIMQDLPGPKNRTGKLKDGEVLLKNNAYVVLTTKEILGDENCISVDMHDLPKSVKSGDSIFLNDGNIELRVISTTKTDVNCKVVDGGILGDDKGLNVPGSKWNSPSITKDDWKHIEFGLKYKVDFIALSFIKAAKDIVKVRHFLEQKGVTPSIIAKIERRQALDNLDEILHTADGAMVARGDLGIEIPIQKVPITQKKIIQKCNSLGKPVIVATQMLESMINSPVPTRAEATDIANAIFDGADAVMLSGETAVGKHAKDAVEIMSLIALEAESALPYEDILTNKGKDLQPQTDDAISYAACHIAQQLRTAAIVAFTSSGSTARRVAKYRPRMPILAITSSPITQRQLCLSWGVHAFKVPDASRISDLFAQGARVARGTGVATKGNLIVITGGLPVAVSGSTNLLKVERV